VSGTSPQVAAPRATQPGFAFVLSFIPCVLSATLLLGFLPDAWLAPWRRFTVASARLAAGLVGLSSSSEGDLLTVNGFTMRIINQCTALDYLVILACAMLLYTRHTLRYRLAGIAVAFPVLLLANCGRLIVSGLVGGISRQAFDLVHDYLWVVLFALLVFGLWTFWVDGRFTLSSVAARRLGLSTLAATGAYLVLHFCHDSYGDLLAWLAGAWYRLLYQDPASTIERVGDLMTYQNGEYRITLDSMAEQVNLAIFLGLMVPQLRRRDLQLPGLTALGLLLLVASNALFIALGSRFAVLGGPAALTRFLALGTLVHLALPLAFYWAMTRTIAESESEGSR